MNAAERDAIVAEAVRRMRDSVIAQIRTGGMGPVSLDRIAKEIQEVMK